MNQWIVGIGVLLSTTAHAGVQNWNLSPAAVKTQSETSREKAGFTSFEIQGYELSRKVGEPALPVKSVLVIGKPESIQVKVQTEGTFRTHGVKPLPVQEQPCRCVTDHKIKFQYNEAAYQRTTPQYELEYLGMWRGQPISRLDVPMARYNHQNNDVTFLSQVRVSYNAETFSLEAGDYKDYLIVVPEALSAGVADFVIWKQQQGYNVIVEKLQLPQITLSGIGKIISKHYTADGTDFVLMVGDEKTLPMHSVSTSGSSSTTSDIKYFTLDGSNDYIPDVFYGRIVATTADEVRINLEKSITFDKTGTKDAQGLQRIVGIASNEGNSPSDDDYIKDIEQSFQQAYGYETKHFAQDNYKSNPQELNKSINGGATWLFYVGHGSGDSWPSMNEEYSINDVPELNNADKIKPVIIDVACMNGRLLPGYLGTTFTDTTSSKAHGAAAYYGGTVNISWDPPALMARGMASEHATKNFKHLGEILLAGQLYLAGNWNASKDVVDNFEWYHLQGDPSMIIQE